MTKTQWYKLGGLGLFTWVFAGLRALVIWLVLRRLLAMHAMLCRVLAMLSQIRSRRSRIRNEVQVLCNQRPSLSDFSSTGRLCTCRDR